MKPPISSVALAANWNHKVLHFELAHYVSLISPLSGILLLAFITIGNTRRCSQRDDHESQYDYRTISQN